jgi:hypothetical protein
MITVEGKNEDLVVRVSGNTAFIHEVVDGHILTECDLEELVDESARGFPANLSLQIQSRDGFGTYFFHELRLAREGSGDAFAMAYYELGSNEPHYISTFIIAISGSFTENAREKIPEKTSKGITGSVYFLDRERITELVERYWNKSLA